MSGRNLRTDNRHVDSRMLEQKQKHELEEKIEEIIEQREEGNGFVNEEGSMYSNAEGHAVGIGIAPMGLAYLLPTPMGELHVIMQLAFMRTGVQKWARGEEMNGHLGDVMHNVGYTVLFSFLTALFFEFIAIRYFGLSFGMTEIDLTQIVLAMMGGA